MKRNIIFSILFTYIFWGCSGSSSSHDHNHDEHEGHDHEAEEHSDEIILKKAEAEAIGLTTKTIRPEKFHGVISCSGTLLAAQGDEVTVVSPVAGVVSLAGKHITDGSSVAKGSVLLNVSAEKMATGDLAKRNCSQDL